MEFLERNPLPEQCLKCTEPECDVCEIGYERWYLPHYDELRLQKKCLLRAKERLVVNNLNATLIDRRIAKIEKELLPFTEEQQAAMEYKIPMTLSIFESCLEVCVEGLDYEMYDALFQRFDPYSIK